jgi:hypothetical protein
MVARGNTMYCYPWQSETERKDEMVFTMFSIISPMFFSFWLQIIELCQDKYYNVFKEMAKKNCKCLLLLRFYYHAGGFLNQPT